MCIIGSGFVGMAVGTGLSSYGINVVFYDLDDSRIQQILQTTTTKVVDKQPAAVHWLSTTSLIRVIGW